MFTHAPRAAEVHCGRHCAPVLPEPNAGEKSPAPRVAVECWWGMVERMGRKSLDRFTRDIWSRFDPRDLEPLKWAILRCRRVLAMQLRP
jgi:hypothetical protein